MLETIPSTPDGTGLRFAVLTASWHGDITARLQAAALETLAAAGTRSEDIVVVEVPGAYELPQVAAWLAKGEDIDGIVALGCVIRGETPHFDFVAAGCAEGLLRVGLDSGIPVGLGVITAETHEQAVARSGTTGSDERTKGGNKGFEAADAVLRLAATYRTLEARRQRS